MTEHKYYLVYDENEFVTSFDAPEDDKLLNEMLDVCKEGKLTAKRVSEFQYKRQNQLAKEDLIY